MKKKNNSYAYIRDKYNFTSNQQLENFLLRTFLGFKLTNKEGSCGPIPLVPDIITPIFVGKCLEQTIDLNSIYTYKALRILEDLLSTRAFRAYELAEELKCPTLSLKVIEKLEDTYLSSQWFNKYCSNNGLRIVNPQTLQDLRRTFCHSRVMEKFYAMLQGTLHDNNHLIYNVDETSYCCEIKGKIVIPENKLLPFVGEDQAIGHITAVFCCNAAGETLIPLLILPALINLPPELAEFQAQCFFASSPSGWMTANIFLIWSIIFTHEINEKRKKLAQIQGRKGLTQPCFLILDGHKSRINIIELEIFYANNIRVIVLPAHSSHITQPFDVGLAGPLKYYYTQSLVIPEWLEKKLANYSQTARKRYLRVLSILDAWKKAAITKNVYSAWTKTGLAPLDVNKILTNKYVRQTQDSDIDECTSGKCKIQINGLEITTFAKRLEISRHCNNIPDLLVPLPIPQVVELSNKIRKGKEKLLSSNCYFYINLGYGYGYHKI